MINPDIKCFAITNSQSKALNLRHCGAEQCGPKQSSGPRIGGCYTIHYIISGKGIYRVGDNIYNLESGEAFLIYPNDIITYVSDENDPWFYCFFSFDGELSEELIARTPFFNNDYAIRLTCTPLLDIITETCKVLNDNISNSDIYATSRLLDMFRVLADCMENDLSGTKNYQHSFIKKSLDYIHMNYSNHITISEIADIVSVNRSYFYRVFKEETGQSPIEYLNTFRIEKARQMLVSTNNSISDIAMSNGFSTFSSFSRIFQIRYKTSPRDYRNKNRL